MAIYYDIPPEQTKSSGSRKIVAVIIIILILLSTGVMALFQFIPSFGSFFNSGSVRVAVIDSGLDQDVSISGRVVAEQSFILPQYGYNITDSSTSDSNPDDGAGNNVRHGTMVTRALLQNSDSAQIVVAKVIDSSGHATASALVAAIYWAVEQNSTVINMSLGTSPSFGDPLQDAVEYAFSKGVIVVSAAGNEGENGIAGNSISSPSVFSKVISVAALDEKGEPAYYSSWGPTADRSMKPDIAIEGFFETSSAIYYGTSFAAPRVSAYVAELVAYCQSKGYEYTPGLIMAALFEGATPLNYPEYIVGAGKANLQQSMNIIDAASIQDGLPRLISVDTSGLPLDFETLFQGDNYTFNVEITTSTVSEVTISLIDIAEGIVEIPSPVNINQVGTVPLSIHVPMSSSPISGMVFIEDAYSNATVRVEITPQVAVARIAFDITHTPWNIDTTYGQFKELYIQLTEQDISVTEIRDRNLLTAEYLSLFDAVFMLDPSAWDRNDTDYNNPTAFSIPFTPDEIDAYEEYFLDGGGIFITALDNSSLDIESLNGFLEWTGASVAYDSVPGTIGVVEITDVVAHPITVGVSSFDYLGASILTNSSYTTLGRFSGKTVLAAFEGTSGGRIVITGTNFFIDNWGMKGMYGSPDDDVLSLRIGLWLTGLM